MFTLPGDSQADRERGCEGDTGDVDCELEDVEPVTALWNHGK